MLKSLRKCFFILLAFSLLITGCSTTPSNPPTSETPSPSPTPVPSPSIVLPEPKPAPTFDLNTPVGMHGRLNVKETYIVDENPCIKNNQVSVNTWLFKSLA